MDRFIGRSDELAACPVSDLKSNMDRFIGGHHRSYGAYGLQFKIQYG